MNSTTLYPMRQLRPKDFPALLREIPDAPSTLYVRGALPAPERKLLCVVGSRACSLYGKQQTQALIAGLAQYPVAVVSGLALGIDAEAHKTALEAGLPVVAVLPSSCDDASIAPKSNWVLARNILQAGGALLSEHKPPFPPIHKGLFAQRNRIMAGISHATLIVEASEQSGTLITARLALDYNRDILAVPHELGRETGEGSNRLIREGATLVRHSADIAEALGLKLHEAPQQLPLPSGLSPEEAAVLEALHTPLERDELIERAALTARAINITLSSLLLRGLIAERLGKIERI